MKKILYAFLAGFIFIAFWQAIIIAFTVPKFILPSPLLVAMAWWHNLGLIVEHSQITMLEVIIGLILGSLLGMITAIQLAYSKTARILLRPMLIFSQALPVFALAPILTLWLGYGLWSKIAMAILIIYFPVTSAFFDGLMRTPIGYLDLAKTMQATPHAIMRYIKIPAAIPHLASGIKLAAVYAPIGAVIGEWVGSSQGLGYLMLLANGRAKTDLMFASMFTLGILSIALYVLANFITNRLIGNNFNN